MKKFFLGRALREKILMLAFALLAVALWGSSVLGRARTRWADWHSAREEFATQQLWLNNADAIATRAAAATQSLEPARTLNATRLVGELSNLAAQSGLTADIGSQRTERTDQFAFNTVQVNFRRSDFAPLLHFYSDLMKRAPYISVERFSLVTDRANPGQLNVSLRVASVELAR
jgi:hypothetical protein